MRRSERKLALKETLGIPTSGGRHSTARHRLGQAAPTVCEPSHGPSRPGQTDGEATWGGGGGPESRSGRQERRQGRDRSEGLLGVGGQTDKPAHRQRERVRRTDRRTDVYHTLMQLLTTFFFKK